MMGDGSGLVCALAVLLQAIMFPDGPVARLMGL